MKPEIALICGGYSGESVISIQSASVIAEQINKEKYNIYLVTIDEKKWICKHNNKEYKINKDDFSVNIEESKVKFDLAFIMIHGTPGENGLLQSYFELLNVPHTTCSAMVSNLTFNKYYTTQLVKSFGVKVSDCVYLNNPNHKIAANELKTLKFPVFVKPNSGGSSIGMSKVAKEEDVAIAIDKAFKVDNEVLIESAQKGDELSCGVMKYKGVIRSFPITLIRSKKEYFDYEAKYTQGMSEEITPPPIDQQLVNEVKVKAEFLYERLNCRGIVRFDFIHTGKDAVFLEVNTIPGMSSASIVPKQARSAGISESELYDMIIENALEN